jgi:hypothetical protein
VGTDGPEVYVRLTGLNIPIAVDMHGTKTTLPSGKRTPPWNLKLPEGNPAGVTAVNVKFVGL